MKGTPDVFHELDKVIANYIGNPYCEIAIKAIACQRCCMSTFLICSFLKILNLDGLKTSTFSLTFIGAACCVWTKNNPFYWTDELLSFILEFKQNLKNRYFWSKIVFLSKKSIFS